MSLSFWLAARRKKGDRKVFVKPFPLILAGTMRTLPYPQQWVIKGPKGPEPALGFFEKKIRIVPKSLESHVDMS